MDNIKVHLHYLNRNLKRLARTINHIHSLNLKVFNRQITFRTINSIVNLLSTVKVTQMRQYLLKRRLPRKKKEKEERKEHPQNKDQVCKCQKMLECIGRRLYVSRKGVGNNFCSNKWPHKGFYFLSKGQHCL
ncbi:hypothetical protein GIB67_037994 [Kingdonia uniflora]|uniref:Uncharacterized protein n=1 Tax=Kingdonia uniflora TaxID=39325 RepID=A0A7J7LHA4_9MAGN|nr:hypothetical protein GIB67_037994 [Kingdonia uniflora]